MQPGFDLAKGPPLPSPWKGSLQIPSDPSLPALGILRSTDLADAIPGIRLGDGPVELRLCNHVPGSRATFEVRAGDRRFAVKFYTEDPAPEARLYERLAKVGLGSDSGARAPRLVTWDSELKMVAMTWLEGPTANHILREGQGARAGHLAAQWLWHATRRRVKLGPPRGRTYMLYQAGLAAGALGAANPSLGAAAKGVAKMLFQEKLRERVNLVHGTLYDRHILDLGDGPGVIDWQQFGQGPAELDGGMFLATISRAALRRPYAALEAMRAKETFLNETRNLLDRRLLEWYWAACLLHRAGSGLRTGRRTEPTPNAKELVEEAAQHARRATCERSGGSIEAQPSDRRGSLFHLRRARPPSDSSHGRHPRAPPPDAERPDRRE
ncbi:MAG TPA: aminoglycoside phosphotransferase family protein [Thermoplasmata archaeon]|nr:aminoglycoside phosphotransferase family protein [Thermoplasmata archaeon]